jgi:MFS family permease
MAVSLRSLFSVSNPRQVWLITVAHAVNEFYSVALPPLLPLLVTDFSVSLTEAGGLLTVFYVVYSVFQLPSGMLADRIGQRGLLAGGMVVLGAGMLLASFAPDYRTLVVAQALAGIGGATYHPTGMSLISDYESGVGGESGGTEGRAMGIHGLGGGPVTEIAPALLGGLAAVFDWRLALRVGALVGIVYAGVFAAFFRAPEGYDTDTDTDAGAVADGGPTEDPRPDGGTRTLRSRIEELTNLPLAWWVVVLFLADFLVSLELGAVRTFAVTYLDEGLGWSTATANGVFFIMLVGGAVASIGGGHLADRVNRRILGVGVLIASAVGLVVTWAVPASLVVVYAWFFVLGVVLYGIFPALNALTTEYSDREFSGSLFGVMLTAGSLGGAVGPLVFGRLADTVGLRVAFPAIAGVAVLAALAFLALFRV